MGAMNNLTPEPTPCPAAPQDREQPGGDCQAAALDLDKILPVLKARLQLVAAPPLIFLRRRPTLELTGTPTQDRRTSGGGCIAALHLDKIPQELKDRPQWVMWRQEMVDGRLAKVP
jgi:hypothetical protein